jgi:hypothetical protein
LWCHFGHAAQGMTGLSPAGIQQYHFIIASKINFVFASRERLSYAMQCGGVLIMGDPKCQAWLGIAFCISLPESSS